MKIQRYVNPAEYLPAHASFPLATRGTIKLRAEKYEKTESFRCTVFLLLYLFKAVTMGEIKALELHAIIGFAGNVKSLIFSIFLRVSFFCPFAFARMPAK